MKGVGRVRANGGNRKSPVSYDPPRPQCVHPPYCLDVFYKVSVSTMENLMQPTVTQIHEGDEHDNPESPPKRACGTQKGLTIKADLLYRR